MANHIGNKINDIFSDELNYNRKNNLIKQSTSNKLVRIKLSKDKDKNYELIIQFNKRQSEQEGNFKGKMKFVNENNDNDIAVKKGLKKLNKEKKNINKIIKKETHDEIKNYLEDNDLILAKRYIEKNKTNSYNPNKDNKDLNNGFKVILSKDSKKNKKTKFTLVDKKSEEKKPEDTKNNENKLKRKKTNTKRDVKNIVMIEKQKYPKKQTIFDRIKGSIKESNNELSNEDNYSLTKKMKKKTSLRNKKLMKSIKVFDSVRTKKQTSNIKIISEKKLTGENDSSNYIKLNLDLINNDSIHSNGKTIKTNKSKITNKKKEDNKNSENDFFHSSKFSNESNSKDDSKESDNNKEDIFHSKSKNQSGIKLKIIKNNSGRIKMKNAKTFNDNKSNKKSQNSSEIDSYSSNSNNNSNDTNKDDSNKENDLDLKTPINKKIQYKYTHGEGVLSIIPEQDNKKMFYEDINHNIESIKPENLITLKQNLNMEKNVSRNLEIKKNNIIINNNVSNNITVNKKESNENSEDIKKNEQINKHIKNNNSKKEGKQNHVKPRKKFPFCCL